MIYCILDAANNACKIGFSANPKARLQQLQTGCPNLLTLYNTIPGTFQDEKTLHQRFSSNKLFGEWFYFTQEINDHFNPYQGMGTVLEIHAPAGMSYLMLFKNITEFKLFNEILLTATSREEKMTWVNDIKERKRICEKLEISEITFKRSLIQLKKINLLLAVNLGVYRINPDYIKLQAAA